MQPSPAHLKSQNTLCQTAVDYDKTSFTRSSGFTGWHGNKITKQEKGQRHACSRGSSLFWSKGACTEIILPGLIKSAVASPSNAQGTLFSRSKTWFPPYRSCTFLHCSYSSLQRWQMQRRRLQTTSVTTSASTFVSGAFYSRSTEPNPEF